MRVITPKAARPASQQGYALQLALLTMVVMALVLTTITIVISRRWDGAQTQLLVQQEIMLKNSGSVILDEYMRNLLPSVNPAALRPGLDYTNWTDATGTLCTPDSNQCWRVLWPAQSRAYGLSSGVGEREIVDVEIQWATGCDGVVALTDMEEQCDRLDITRRLYERITFLQYQLHYSESVPSPKALAAIQLIYPGLVDNNPALAFTSEDVFDGPVHTNNPGLLYCGSPIFEYPPTIVPPSSNYNPFEPSNPFENSNQHDPTNAFFAHPECSSTDTPLTRDTPPVAAVTQAGRELTVAGVSGATDCSTTDWLAAAEDHPSAVKRTDRIDLASAEYANKIVWVDDTNQIDIFNSSPSTPLIGPVTIVARNNIVIHDNIIALNGIVALITGCDILLEPTLIDPTSTCVTHGDGDDVMPTATDDLILENVAILAPVGAMWFTNWHLPICADDPVTTHREDVAPHIIFEGSQASKHKGLYGLSDFTGTPSHGWSKRFTYPTKFWLERPLWWPSLSQGEWRLISERNVAVVSGNTAETFPYVFIDKQTLSLTEGSDSLDTFMVALTTQPSFEVRITINQQIASSLAFSALTLTFTKANWAIAQSVNIDASSYQDDDTLETLLTVTLAASSADTDYHGLKLDLQITILDDDSPDLKISADRLTVDENDSVEFMVSLVTMPADQVTVTLSSNDSTVVTIIPETLIFTTSNWMTEQSVTVDAANDDTADNESVNISLLSTSTDTHYNALTKVILVEVVDDDLVALLLSSSAMTIDEETTATFDVSLNSKPTGTVTVTVGSNIPTKITVSPTTLTFTTTNWMTKQFVVVTSLDDTDFENDNVLVSLDASDGGYDTAFGTLDIMITDNDAVTVEVNFARAGYSISELFTTSATIEVSLNTDPLRTVILPLAVTQNVGIVANDYSGVPAFITFNSGDTATSFTITALNEGDDSENLESLVIAFGSLPSAVTSGATSATTVSIVTQQPAPPENLVVVCGATETTASWSPASTGQPTDSYEVDIDVVAPGTDTPAVTTTASSIAVPSVGRIVRLKVAGLNAAGISTYTMLPPTIC